MRKRLLTSVIMTLLAISVACAPRKAGDPLRPGFNVFSKEQDIQLGQEAAAQVRQQVDIVANTTLQNYISNLGTKLAAQPEAGNFPYTFTLINDKSINAFALPGGPIFINTGTVAAGDNEAQLAGVIAHEIAHVALRHSTNQASKANVIQLPAVLASAALGQGSILTQLAQLGLGLGVNSVLLKYSRDAETEADALGARIMAKAGYNPIEMAHFFEKLEAQGGSGALQFLSSHPNPGNRRRAIEAESQTIKPGKYTASTGRFQQIKQLVAQLPPPRPPRQLQQSRSQPARVPQRPQEPSADFQRLQASRYSLAYPSNWEAFADNDSAMVTIAPKEGLVPTANGGVAIGYGAVVNYYFPRSGRVDLKAGTRELLRQLQGTNQGMRATGNARQIKVDGRSGMITYLSGASPYGGEETNVLLTVERPEGLFYMVFVAPSQHFQSIQPLFQKMLGSIQFLS